MNNEPLIKLIKAVVLPQYPFIVDFEVSRELIENLTGMRVEYSMNMNFNREEEERLYRKLNDETKNMFKLIGYPRNVIYLPILVNFI